MDIFLTKQLKISRSQVQKLIADKRILLNGAEPKKTGERLAPDDAITISGERKKTPTPKTKTIREEPGEQATALIPEIVAQTKEYVVINKPAGLLVHPTQANEKTTLASWLVKKFPKIKTVGDDPKIRPGIVHRLDKEASGVMVVALTQPMFESLKEQFKTRSILKEYLALAHGRISKDWDEITFPIARGKTNDRMAARPLLASKNVGSRQWTDEENEPHEGLSPTKEALTEFIVEKRFVNCTLIRVTLHTGRMHQIRVHLLAYNNPLVGDPLYNQKKRKQNLDKKCGRLFLHSVKLGFTDLDGTPQTFEAPLPPDLQKLIHVLK